MHHFLFESFIILLFSVQNAFVVAYEIKVHLNHLHCLVSYCSISDLAFMHHVLVINMPLDSLRLHPVLAIPRAMSLLALPLCMSPLKFQRNGFIQAPPILFMPVAFDCRFFSPRHFAKVAAVVAQVLAEKEFCLGLPASQRWGWWNDRELTGCAGAPVQWLYLLHPSDSLVLTWLHLSDVYFIWPGFFKDIQAKGTAETLWWTEIYYLYTTAMLPWLLCVYSWSLRTWIWVHEHGRSTGL